MVTDGLTSTRLRSHQALHVFREALYTGRRGPPRLVLAEGVRIARVKKRYQRRQVVEVIREVVAGSPGRR